MYNHTQNENGTYNTLCLHCFMTIASAVQNLHELETVETFHVCPERVFSDLQAKLLAQPSVDRSTCRAA